MTAEVGMSRPGGRDGAPGPVGRVEGQSGRLAEKADDVWRPVGEGGVEEMAATVADAPGEVGFVGDIEGVIAESLLPLSDRPVHGIAVVHGAGEGLVGPSEVAAGPVVVAFGNVEGAAGCSPGVAGLVDGVRVAAVEPAWVLGLVKGHLRPVDPFGLLDHVPGRAFDVADGLIDLALSRHQGSIHLNESTAVSGAG